MNMNKDEHMCWYHGKLSRECAEELIKEAGEDGTFLVRESSTAAGDFVLTLLYQGEVCHYQIRRFGEDAFFSIENKNKKILHGLDKLIEFYQQDANGLVTKLTKFLRKDPPPNDTRSHGTTNLLHRAVIKNNHIIVSELLKCGYRNIDAKNQDGQTALHLAAIHGDEEMLNLLIQAGVNINCMDTSNYMPLHYASRHQSRSCIHLLIAAQANIQGRNIKNGYVPLHEAGKHGNLDAAKELLSNHAPLLPRTLSGEFPIDLAKEGKHLNVITFLENYKLSPATTYRSNWYHGTLKREEAVAALKEFASEMLKRDGDSTDYSGSFLVRFSERKDTGSGYVLTMLSDDTIKNFIISQSSNYLFIDDGPFLPSLEHLVEHFMHFADGLPIKLKYPVPPKPKPPLPLFSTMPRIAKHKKKNFENSFNTNDHAIENLSYDIEVKSSNSTAIHSNTINSSKPADYHHHHHHHHSDNHIKKKAKDHFTSSSVFSTLKFRSSSKKSSLLDSMSTLRKQNKTKEKNLLTTKETTVLSNDEELQKAEVLLKNLSFSTEFNNLIVPCSNSFDDQQPAASSILQNSNTDDFYKVPKNNSAIADDLDVTEVRQASTSKRTVQSWLENKTEGELEYFTKSDVLIERERFQQQLPNDVPPFQTISTEYIPTIDVRVFMESNTGSAANKIDDICQEQTSTDELPAAIEFRNMSHSGERENSQTSNLSNSTEIFQYLNRQSSNSSTATNQSPDAVNNMKLNYFIPRERLVLECTIGEGEFGWVYRGHIIPVEGEAKVGEADDASHMKVAVKTLRDEHCQTNRQEFLREASVMIRLKHHCIVQLIGISKGETLMIIQELVALGSMLQFILNNKQKINANYELKLWASQIACGMEYLESRHFVHRDLAARNILLASRNQAKISDFGLSRALANDNHCYQASQGGKWPIKWYAPESFNNGLFSHASDVWSFGVTLWEMFSLGESPYGDIRGIDAIEIIEKGERLPQPQLCPDDIYDIMQGCWSYKPKNRPTFRFLRDYFSRDPDYQNIIELIQTEHIS